MKVAITSMEFPAKIPTVPTTQGIVCGPGSPLHDVIRACSRIAVSDATVLITGETGTGKEVFARMIHDHSARSRKPFVPVNCAAIPEALLESELFGYVRGAFTGAVGSRRGRVAMAEGGTLFLDEVGDLSLPLQVKLLRLLQNHTYEPVGSSESVTGDFRLVAATNRDMAEDVRAGRFRRDLYYRLHVCPLVLPPLRERQGDIGALFYHFWQKHGEARVVAPAVIRVLEKYAWPGNVRELENLAERVSVCAESSVIGVQDLPPPYRGDTTSAPLSSYPLVPFPTLESMDIAIDMPTPPPVHGMATKELSISSADEITPPPAEIDDLTAPVLHLASLHGSPAPFSLARDFRLPVDLPRLLRETEETYIRLALEQSGGNKKEAAKLLGMGRTTLVEKLRRKAASTEPASE